MNSGSQKDNEGNRRDSSETISASERRVAVADHQIDSRDLFIGTREITLIDGSTFRTPRIGVTTHKGVNMDKEGVQPDVVVDVHPDQLARRQDAQLEKAVAVLIEDVALWKKMRPPVASSPATGSSGAGPGAAPIPGPPPTVVPRKEE